MERKIAKQLIEAVCAVTNDRTTLDIARWVTMRPGGRAEEFLLHYLNGSGADKAVDIYQLLNEDGGVRGTVEGVIGSMVDLPLTPSQYIPIRQQNFQNQDWRYATGSLNMHWKQIPYSRADGAIMVELSFRNEYRWHPKENRISRCVHQAAEDLKQRGAKDYWMIGRPVTYSFYPHKMGVASR